MQDISFTVQIFKEGKVFVAHVPELDVSSCGDTEEETRKNMRDARLETAEAQGTLSDVLEEAAFHKEGDTWQAPQFVATDRVTLQFK